MGSSEIDLRLRSVRAGVWVTLVLAAAAAAYLLATPHGPHRPVLLVVPILAAVDAVVVRRLAPQFAAGRYVALIVAWNVSQMAMGVVAAVMVV